MAIVTAIVGVAVAVGTYLKKKADAIGENLDFDDDIYCEDDDYYNTDVDYNLEQEQLSEIDEEELEELEKLDKE